MFFFWRSRASQRTSRLWSGENVSHPFARLYRKRQVYRVLYGFRIQKNYRRTTFAGKIYYPSLIKGYKIIAPNTIWQTDITYIYVKEEDRFYYSIFIIDVYTKKIVGYRLSNHMRATANEEALSMVLEENPSLKFHHSDHGIQYSSNNYTGLLKEKNIAISMAQPAQDNAYAERINKTIKEEYLDYWKPKNFRE